MPTTKNRYSATSVGFLTAHGGAGNPPRFSFENIDDDVFVRIRSGLLVIGDSIMTDRHHASNGNYADDDPQNQIGGIIPAFPLSGWLRHGMERVVHEYGSTACHPGEANANFRKEDVYARDLEAGYHAKGSCVADPNTDNGGVVFNLFGGFGNRPGKVMRRPINYQHPPTSGPAIYGNNLR